MATNDDFLNYLRGRQPGANSYAAGEKRYGPAGASAPNIGAVQDNSGYRKRDNSAATRKWMMMKRLKAMRQGKYGSADAQRPIGNLFPGPGGF